VGVRAPAVCSVRSCGGSLKTAPREHMAVVARDATYGLRLMRKYPLATAAAISTIALGVGANTAMFTVEAAAIDSRLPLGDIESLPPNASRNIEAVRDATA
jgi:hypothetical protein